MKILVTGGAGFIGGALVRMLINDTVHSVFNIDKLTYAGNLDSLNDVSESPRYQFEQSDINNSLAVEKIFESFKPDIVMHLAAESHVDRSINAPAEFLQTNIMGTYALLEEAKKYWLSLDGEQKNSFRFLHVSTDEVFGDLEDPKEFFTEKTSYSPSSPYSASKAASDHLVRAWGRTYGLPVVITNCSNNYGPFHFPEKLIPLVILKALKGESIPVYGSGSQIRDWLYVEDHVKALLAVAVEGRIGETYNIGGHNEKTNLEVVTSICTLLEEFEPCSLDGINTYADLITFVEDRPGHDLRYAIDASKIQKELAWQPSYTFETGLRKTVEWYIKNQWWTERVLDGSYNMSRLGVL